MKNSLPRWEIAKILPQFKWWNKPRVIDHTWRGWHRTIYSITLTLLVQPLFIPSTPEPINHNKRANACFACQSSTFHCFCSICPLIPKQRIFPIVVLSVRFERIYSESDTEKINTNKHIKSIEKTKNKKAKKEFDWSQGITSQSGSSELPFRKTNFTHTDWVPSSWLHNNCNKFCYLPITILLTKCVIMVSSENNIFSYL